MWQNPRVSKPGSSPVERECRMVMLSMLFWRQVHLSPCKQKERIGEEERMLVVLPAITSIGSYCLTTVVLDVGWLLWKGWRYPGQRTRNRIWMWDWTNVEHINRRTLYECSILIFSFWPKVYIFPFGAVTEWLNFALKKASCTPVQLVETWTESIFVCTYEDPGESRVECHCRT